MGNMEIIWVVKIANMEVISKIRVINMENLGGAKGLWASKNLDENLVYEWVIKFCNMSKG